VCTATIDYLTIGHVTHDILPNGARAVGGTVAYATLTAAALGRTVGALTSAGPDFNTTVLDKLADVVWVPASQTTTFENIYPGKERQQFIYAVANPLTLAHIPTRWANVPLVHIGPVMAECTVNVVVNFAARAFVGVTPQGWLRTYDATGRIKSVPWARASQILPAASAVVLSLEDVGRDWSLLQQFAQQTTVLVVTQGERGGTLFVGGKSQAFSAITVREIDPTGAGDIFATAFFIAMASKHAPMNAASFAACLAGYSVTRRGVDSVPRY